MTDQTVRLPRNTPDGFKAFVRDHVPTVDPDWLYRELYDALSPAQEELPGDHGSWLWKRLVEWCNRRGLAPAQENDLFRIVGDLRARLKQGQEAVNWDQECREATDLINRALGWSSLKIYEGRCTERDFNLLLSCVEKLYGSGEITEDDREWARSRLAAHTEAKGEES